MFFNIARCCIAILLLLSCAKIDTGKNILRTFANEMLRLKTERMIKANN